MPVADAETPVPNAAMVAPSASSAKSLRELKYLNGVLTLQN